MAKILVLIMVLQFALGIAALAIALVNRPRPIARRLILGLWAGVAIFMTGDALSPFWHRGWPAMQAALTALIVALILAFLSGRRGLITAAGTLTLGCISFFLARALLLQGNVEWRWGQRAYNAAIMGEIQSHAEEILPKAPPDLRNRVFPAGRMPAPLLVWMRQRSHTFDASHLRVNLPIVTWYTPITGLYRLRPAKLEIYYGGGKPLDHPQISVKVGDPR